jgi:hypothetical protein
LRQAVIHAAHRSRPTDGRPVIEAAAARDSPRARSARAWPSSLTGVSSPAQERPDWSRRCATAASPPSATRLRVGDRHRSARCPARAWVDRRRDGTLRGHGGGQALSSRSPARSARGLTPAIHFLGPAGYRAQCQRQLFRPGPGGATVAISRPRRSPTIPGRVLIARLEEPDDEVAWDA